MSNLFELESNATELNSMREVLETKGEFIGPKEQNIRTREELEEAIPKGIPSKCAFTVNIQTSINTKFNEIWAYYQSKHNYGKVYKHQVLQLIIDEVHTNMKAKRLID